MTIVKARIVTVVAVLIGLPLVYAGCVAQNPVEMQTNFDESEHKPYTQLGGNGIIGQAFLSQQGGNILSCAGGDVLIVPATSFFHEMISHVRAGNSPLIIEKIPPSFRSIIKTTQCDAQGNFSAGELPNGKWFVWANVHWIGGLGGQGGDLVREVTLSNNETVQVSLTDKEFVHR
jgi:hypothetical protein